MSSLSPLAPSSPDKEKPCVAYPFKPVSWQKPCYLLQDGYAATFKELMEDTAWDRYGTGRDERCADCMVHCGYEASAVDDTFGSWRGFLSTVRAVVFGLRTPAPELAEDSASAPAGASGAGPAPGAHFAGSSDCSSHAAVEPPLVQSDRE